MLGNFDFLLELQEDAIEKLIRTSFFLYSPDFPFVEVDSVPVDFWAMLSYSGYDVMYHMIIDDIQVELADTVAGLKAQFSIPFHGGSLSFGDDVIGQEVGGIARFGVPLVLADIGGGVLSPKIAIQQVSIDITWNSNVDQQMDFAIHILRQQLNDTSLEKEDIYQMIEDKVEYAVRQNSDISLGVFQVVPNQDGSLNPLVFSHLEMDILSTAAKNIIRIGGNLFGDRQGQLAQLTESMSQDENYGIEISTDAITKFVVCPIIAEEMSKNFNVALSDDQLPKPCGSGSSYFDYGDIDIRLRSVSLSTNPTTQQVIVRLSTRVNPNETGVNHVDIKGTIAIGLAYEYGDLRVTSVNVNSDIDLDLEWWADVLAFAFLGVLYPILKYFGEEIAEGYADDALESELQRGITSALLALPQEMSVEFGPVEMSVDDFEITNNSFIIRGGLEVDDAFDTVPQPQVLLTKYTNSSTSELISREVITTTEAQRDQCEVLEAEYEITEHAFTTTFSVGVDSFKLVPLPHTYQWRLKTRFSGSTQGDVVELTQQSGTAQLAADTTDAVPGQSSSNAREIRTSVSVDYEILDDILRLTNNPVDRNYALYVELTIRGTDGNEATGQVMRLIKGYEKRGDDEYNADVRFCRFEQTRSKLPRAFAIAQLRQDLERLTTMNVPTVESLTGTRPVTKNDLVTDPIPYDWNITNRVTSSGELVYDVQVGTKTLTLTQTEYKDADMNVVLRDLSRLQM